MYYGSCNVLNIPELRHIEKLKVNDDPDTYWIKLSSKYEKQLDELENLEI